MGANPFFIIGKKYEIIIIKLLDFGHGAMG